MNSRGQGQGSGYDYNPWMGGGAAMGAGLGSMLAPWENPAEGAGKYMDRIPGQIDKYFNPYIQAGQRALPGLENQYGRLMNNPGQRMNEIGQDFHQSPGFQFAMQQALQGAGHAAAAGGMVGSPQHEQWNMQLGTDMANQEYNHWLQNALGMYGQGLQGQQGIYNTGANAGMRAGENMADYFGHRAQLEYAGQNSTNQHDAGGWGAFLGGAGSLAGAYFGGPFGAAAGGAIGRGIGGE